MQPVQITFLALLLAHLLGDFPLQTHWISRQKGARALPLICHGLIHGVAAWGCLAAFTPVPFASPSSQTILLAYLVSHLAIDRAKCKLTAKGAIADDWKAFLADQATHLALLSLTAVLLTRSSFASLFAGIGITETAKIRLLQGAIVYVAVIFGGGYLIRYLTRGFAGKSAAQNAADLGNAGLYVGWIERFLIVTAIVMQSPVLVGLILTGKSIARFPEFKEARFAEYFLIGTLLSISVSVLGGLVLLELLYGAVSLK